MQEFAVREGASFLVVLQTDCLLLAVFDHRWNPGWAAAIAFSTPSTLGFSFPFAFSFGNVGV